MVASLTRRTQVAFCSAVTAYFSTMLKARSPCSWSATMCSRKKVTSSSVKPYFSMSGGVVLEYTTGTCDSRPTLIAAIASTNGRRDCPAPALQPERLGQELVVLLRVYDLLARLAAV